MDDNNRTVHANPPESSMLASLMTVAAAYAVQRKIPLEEVADAAGLEPHALLAPVDRVPEDAVSRILGMLQQRFPDEAVAVDMVAAAPVHFLGPLEPIARIVPTLKAGIELFVYYRSVLATSALLEFLSDPPGPLLRLEHPNDEEFGSVNAEMGLAMGTRAVVEVLGVPNALRGVWIAHTPAGPPERYAEFFGVPVRFDAPDNALLFHAHRLDDPVDPDAGARLRVLRAHLDIVRSQLHQANESDELRLIRDAAAQNAANGEFTADALANRLGLGLRTLQRRTDDLGTSASEIIDGLREATARQLLADADLSTFEIAIALGYSTDSTFRRAFRRWTGQSPTQFRQSPTSTG